MGTRSRLLGALLPGRCPVCETPGPAPCGTCWAALRPSPPGSAVPAGLDGCRSLLRYEGVGRELVARLKYRNARSAVAWLADGMAQLAATLVVTPPQPGPGPGLDVVTWAPTSRARRRARGFDQGEVLARAVARRLGVPCGPLLVRRPGPPQTGRSRAERRSGPAFVIGRGPPPVGARVLLVDDVVTSGATLSSAADALRAAGAAAVLAVTAGRTPLKVPERAADG
ncbi:MAG TPA: phosphoribosyltransferase family protein [Acidimicrobiales bacterium]|nr:phosphoribosyltransferase family protein [Acidimicrobiales bacterium]